MKWCMSPSEYRYSISVSSMIARSTMSTERKRCSMIEPLFRLRSRAWTSPRRLPGVLCWVSKTRNRSPSCLMTIPRLSFVAWIIAASSPKTPIIRAIRRAFAAGSGRFDLQPAQVHARREDTEAGGLQARLDRLAAPRSAGARRGPHRHHPASAGPADLGRAAPRPGRLGDPIDVGRRHPGGEALARLPLRGNQLRHRLELLGQQGLAHLYGYCADRGP